MSLAKQAQLFESNLPPESWEDGNMEADTGFFASDLAMAKEKEEKEKEDGGFEIEELFVGEDDGLEGLDEELEAAEEEVDEEDKEDEDDAAILQVEEGGQPIQAFTFSLPMVPGSDLEEDDLDEIVVDEPEDEIEVAERDRWDWAGGGLPNFLSWLQGMFNSVPAHSGNETAGIERAIAFLQSLDKCISKAVRSDIKDELDIAQVEEARKAINDGIDRLEDRYERLMAGRKRNKKKSELHASLVKEAQKITGVGHVVVTVPLLISRIARVCINGMVSAGHDIEDMFDRQVKAYNLDKREQAELMQLLEDMGYPMRRDRGFTRDEQIDRTRSDNYDWAANYPA